MKQRKSKHAKKINDMHDDDIDDDYMNRITHSINGILEDLAL